MRPLAAIVIAFLVQTIVLPALGSGRVAPDFLLATVVVIALAFGSSSAIGYGVLAGLLQDSFSGAPLGMNGFSKPLVAFAAARFREDPLLGASLGAGGAGVFLALAAFADSAVLWALREVIGAEPITGRRWLAVGLGVPVTVTWGILVFRGLSPRRGR